MGYHENKHLHKNRFSVAYNCSTLRAITICSTFTTDCGYDNSTIILIGDVYCLKTKFSAKFCLHKKDISISRQRRLSFSAIRVCVPGAQYSFWGSKEFLFLFSGQGVYIFEESPKSIQDVIGDVYCPGEYCLNRENCESLGGYVTTLRSIRGCGECGAWLFVHKVPFMLQDHVNTTKTDKTRFFFVKKTMKMVPNRQNLTNVPFQLTKYRKKDLWVDNKVWETVGVV